MSNWKSSTSVVNDQYEEGQAISLMAFDQYLHELRWSELLAEEEVVRLLRLLVRAKREPENAWVVMRAKHARNQLVEAYQLCVSHIARGMVSYCNGALEMLDLVQEGTIAFLSWLDTYDFFAITSSRVFAACLVKVVRFALVKVICESGGQVRIPRSVHRRLKLVQKAQGELFQELRREPSFQEIAWHLGVGVQEVCVLLEQQSLVSVGSVEKMCTFDGEEASDYVDFVSAFACEGKDDGVGGEKAEMVRRAVTYVLPSRQRDVICLCYGLDGENGEQRTHAEVASMIGISEHASESAEHLAKRRLREVLAPVVEEGQPVGSLPFLCLGEEYCTLQEACALLGCSDETIRCARIAGRLTSMKVGKKVWLLRSEIEALVKKVA